MNTFTGLAFRTEGMTWTAGVIAVVAAAGAAMLLIKRRRIRAGGKPWSVPAPEEEAPAAEEAAALRPVHATVREIQLNPEDYISKTVRIFGRLSFSHRQTFMDGERWHMFEDETGRMPAVNHEEFSGKGEITAVVEETKMKQIYLKIVGFSKP